MSAPKNRDLFSSDLLKMRSIEKPFIVYVRFKEISYYLILLLLCCNSMQC